MQKILAVEDRMFFICDDVLGNIPVTVVRQPSGPHAVARNLFLELPEVR